MNSNLCLVVGFTHTNVPTTVYLGFDLSAARAAAAAASKDYHRVQVFRNLGVPYQELRTAAA